MELCDKNYPYPVLTPRGDDYVACSFDVEGESIKHDSQLELKLNAKLDCASLQTLIKRGSAAIVLHVECSRSAYRKSHELPLGAHSITISSDDISGRVSLCPFIVAKQDICDYKSTQFNPIYQDMSFCLRAGAVLAEGIEKSVFVDTSTRDIDYKPDIFSVVPDEKMNDDPDEKSRIRVDPCNQKITICMPTKAYSQYAALLKSGISIELVRCVVVLPAMIEALARMRSAYAKDEIEDFEGYVWFNTVKERLMQIYPAAKQDFRQFVLEKMVVSTVAQALIKSPVVDALNMLANTNSVMGGSDEN